jgi:hypothetical protein
VTHYYVYYKVAPSFEALLEREGAKLGVQRTIERFICAEKPA